MLYHQNHTLILNYKIFLIPMILGILIVEIILQSIGISIYLSVSRTIILSLLPSPSQTAGPVGQWLPHQLLVIG